MGGETQNFVFLVIGFRGCALEADDGLGVGFSVGPLATPSAIFTQLKKTQLEDKQARKLVRREKAVYGGHRCLCCHRT